MDTKRLDLQNAEFNALDKLITEWKVLESTAVVDDDYPRARHYYESALRDFITTLMANSRIEIPTVVERPQSVLQDWVMTLPRREQGVLLSATRSCDTAPKGDTVSPERKLTAFLRYTFMVPADDREVGIEGAFMSSMPPLQWRASAFAHYPTHWYSHLMHAFQVIGYRHPDKVIAHQALTIYHMMVESLHLGAETKNVMIARLSADRIASGKVVS